MIFSILSLVGRALCSWPNPPVSSAWMQRPAFSCRFNKLSNKDLEALLDRGREDGGPLNFEGHAAIDGLAAEVVGRLLHGFARALSAEIVLPVAGSVVGVSVEVRAVFYLDQPLRGLICRCLRVGVMYELDLLDVEFPADSEAAALVGRYRRWLGLSVASPQRRSAAEGHAWSVQGRLQSLAPSVLGLYGLSRRHRAPVDPVFEGDASELQDLYAADGTLELVVTSCKATRLRCRLLSRMELEVVLYSRRHSFVPSEILTVMVAETNRRHRSLMLTAQVRHARVDIAALRLTPLQLWMDPPSTSGAVADERPAVELEAPVDKLMISDAVAEAYDMHLRSLEPSRAGLSAKLARLASYPLFDLLAVDLRCLDAYAYLGEFALDHGDADRAQRHFDAGVEIGSLSLGPSLKGRLPWGRPGNRGLLRCLRGQALCARAKGDRGAERSARARIRGLDVGPVPWKEPESLDPGTPLT